MQQCPRQPTRIRQTSNLVLEELSKGWFSIKFTKLSVQYWGNKKVYIHNSSTGARLKRHPGHTRSCTSLAFSRSGGHLATSSLGGEIIVWPLDDEADFITVPLVVESIDWCPTTNMVVAAVGPLVMFWDINSGARYGYVKFTPAGDSILTGISNVSYRYTPRQTLAAIDTEAKTANNDSDDELDSSSHGVIQTDWPHINVAPSIQPGSAGGQHHYPLRQVELNFNFQLLLSFTTDPGHGDFKSYLNKFNSVRRLPGIVILVPDLSYADDDDEIQVVEAVIKARPNSRKN
ncbi:hypothetical protein TNCV_2805481 [Trichonephila clavipes]|nr:hypothetical protein TNCV_2805481 [Trichonephila clavipes]